MSDWKEHRDEGFESEYFCNKFGEILRMVENPETQRFNGEINRLKGAMRPITSLSRIRSLTADELVGREWLFDKIEEWDNDSNSRIFWIMAGPGFGKSTFAAYLSQRYNARIPAVQFVEWGKKDHTDPCSIIRNLSFQLAVRYSEYRSFLLTLPIVSENNLSSLDESELFDLLFCECTWFKVDGLQEDIWILIDALDEADGLEYNRIAQTLSRHINKLPRWIRFIITSREDPKVILPLQSFRPQVFDIEEYVIEHNNIDMNTYIQNKLGNLNPTKWQIDSLLSKSQGVFLYLVLCVGVILKGTYSLDDIDVLPGGLNGYYYELFTRQFSDKMDYYREKAALIFKVMLGSNYKIDISILKYFLNSSFDISEDEFYTTLRSIATICRIVKEEKSTRQIYERESLVFFHNSIQIWLTDYKCSGPFYVSQEEGSSLIQDYYLCWLTSIDEKIAAINTGDGFAIYGIPRIAKLKEAYLEQAGYKQLSAILHEMCPHNSTPAVGDYTEMHTDGRLIILSYCEMLFNTGRESSFAKLIGDFVECVKDDYTMIGLIDPKTRMVRYDTPDFEKNPVDPWLLNDVMKCAGSIGFLCKNLSRKGYFFSKNTIKVIDYSLGILGYYNMRMSEKFSKYPIICFGNIFYGAQLEMYCIRDEILQNNIINQKNKVANKDNKRKWIANFLEKHLGI